MTQAEVMPRQRQTARQSNAKYQHTLQADSADDTQRYPIAPFKSRHHADTVLECDC